MEDKIENLANLTPEERENLDKYENFLLKRNSIYFYIFIHGIKKIETILDLIKDKNKKQKFLNKCLNIKSLTIEIRDSILNIDTLKKQEYFSTLKTFINQLFEDEEIKKIIETDKKEYNSVSLLYQMLNNSLDIIFNNENSYLDSSYEKYIIQSILMEKIIKKVFNTKNKKIEFTQNGYNFSLEKKKDSWEKYPIIIKISSPKYKIEIELKNNNFHLSTSDLHGYNDNFKTAMAMYLNEFNNIKKANNETIINDMKSLSLKITKDHLNKEIKSIRTEIFLSSNIRFLSRILNKIIKIEK